MPLCRLCLPLAEISAGDFSCQNGVGVEGSHVSSVSQTEGQEPMLGFHSETGPRLKEMPARMAVVSA